MSIKGSKSKFAVREGIPGIENTQDLPIHVTAQSVTGERIALDVVSHGVYEVSNTGVIGAASVKRLIQSVAHGAKAGDIIKMTSGNSLDAEIPIIEIVDADFFVIPYEADIAVADTFNLLRHVTPKYAADGSTSVTITTAPTQFILDGIPQQVIEDTVAPANNRAMPNRLFVDIDGVQYAVSKDTGTPANTVSVPVEITGAAGPINITAGDLNVQLTDLGANFDRTRIGDGTNQWNMTAIGEGLVHDPDVLVELQTLNGAVATEATLALLEGKDFATEAKQDAILAELQLKADLTETQPVSLASVPLPTGAATEATLNNLLTAFNAEDFATSAKQDTIITSLSSIAAEDFATEATLAAMSAKLPASLGKKADTASFSVTLATNEVLSTQERALACGTVTDLTIAGSGVTTINAPVGARGMKIQAGINNTSDLLVGLGGATPDNTTKTGLEFQPGRSEDIQGASNVEVTAYDPAATNQKIVIVWSYV
jgi:hypothetical protein